MMEMKALHALTEYYFLLFTFYSLRTVCILLILPKIMSCQLPQKSSKRLFSFRHKSMFQSTKAVDNGFNFWRKHHVNLDQFSSIKTGCCFAARCQSGLIIQGNINIPEQQTECGQLVKIFLFCSRKSCCSFPLVSKGLFVFQH